MNAYIYTSQTMLSHINTSFTTTCKPIKGTFLRGECMKISVGIKVTVHVVCVSGYCRCQCQVTDTDNEYNIDLPLDW